MKLLLQKCYKITTFLQTLLVYSFFLSQKYAFAFESAHTFHLVSGIRNNFSLVYNITQGLRNSGTLRFSATFHNGWLYHCETFLLVYPKGFADLSKSLFLCQVPSRGISKFSRDTNLRNPNVNYLYYNHKYSYLVWIHKLIKIYFMIFKIPEHTYISLCSPDKHNQ